MAEPQRTLPGSEFLQRRLRRAQAVPPAEAPADVHAFVQSSKLLGAICEQLPAAPGKPLLLPEGPDTAGRLVAGLYWLALELLCARLRARLPACLPPACSCPPACLRACAWHRLAAGPSGSHVCFVQMHVQLQGFDEFIELSGPRMRSALEQGRGLDAMPTPEEAAQQVVEEMAAIAIGEQHRIRHPVCHSACRCGA